MNERCWFWVRLIAWSAVAYMASFHSRWFMYAAFCLLFLGVEGQSDINRRNESRLRRLERLRGWGREP